MLRIVLGAHSAVLFSLFLVACTSGQPGRPADDTPAPGAAQDCESISPGSISGPQGNIGQYSACMQPANCVAGNGSAVVDLGTSYCAQLYDATCSPGDCLLPQACRAEYSLQRSSGVAVFGCAAVADPDCTVPGEQKCTCSLGIAAAGRLSCHCVCRTS